jgi:hypothetical protein
MMITPSRSASAEPAPAAETQRAARVFSATGIGGGVIVHLGATDGKFTAALKANDHCCVQGLTTDTAACDAARQYIQSRGLYGTVSVAPYDGQHLPYVDNLAALVVVDDPAVPMAEVMRVLRPLGAAVLNRAGRDEVTVKPWPEEYDQWQQHYHGPDNNAVAHDSAVGPPRHYQWIAFPQWQRSHHIMPSMNCLLASQSRLYTVEDVASAEHPALPGKYALICRDAFSGIELWRMPFPDWHPDRFSTGLRGRIRVLRLARGGRLFAPGGGRRPGMAFRAPAQSRDLRAWRESPEADDPDAAQASARPISHRVPPAGRPRASEFRYRAVRRTGINLETRREGRRRSVHAGLNSRQGRC